MATTTTTRRNHEYDTIHRNGPWPTATEFATAIDGRLEQQDFFACYLDAAKEVQRLIELARSSGQGFRAFGSSWSLNHIAHHQHHMHFNRGMNLRRAITSADLHADSTLDADNLFFFQCGSRVKEINNYLFTFGKSLKTSGASNGQTIAGCISTGVHGSAHQVGSMQDFVMGLDLIIGPQATDRVYLESEKAPALSNAFAARLGSRVIRNEGLFQAALVGLGSFGFIHGVVIETEDLFLLNRYTTTIPRSEALRLAKTMDFKNSSFSIPGEKDARGKPNEPHHFKIFFNPHRNDPDLVVEIMYKKPYQPGYPDPIPRVRTALYTELLTSLGRILGKIPRRIPAIVRLLEKTALPVEDGNAVIPVTGTHAQIFFDSIQQGPAFACEVCVELNHAEKAYDIMSKLARDIGPMPGLFAMRFVKQSKALLSSAAYPVSCMLEINGVISSSGKAPQALAAFCTATVKSLQDHHIPFTIHWGKTADWKYPGLVTYMFGHKATEWRRYRSALLTKEMAALFSNRFLTDTELDRYSDDAPAAIAQSLA